MNFFHFYQPNPVFIQIGPITVHWYGLIIAVAILTAILTASWLAKRRGLNVDDLFDLSLWAVIAGLIGARLYDVLVVDWAYFSRHLDRIANVWEGGMAIHGGVIGGAVALVVWADRKKQSLWPWLDIGAVVLPLAQAIGRWGNYFNSELFGGPTDLPWGIPIRETLRPLIYKSEQYFHPAFLYESVLNLLLFIILLTLFRQKRLKTGQAAGAYLVGYGLIRFAMEFIRIDPTGMVFGVRAPQLVSFLAVVIGISIFWNKKKTRP